MTALIADKAEADRIDVMAKTGESPRRLTIFYDGSCPLCRKEIAFYRKRRGADALEWEDVSKCGSDEVVPGLAAETAMQRFHVRLPDGSLASGGDAFRAIWRELPLMKPLVAILADLPGMQWLLNAAYDRFLPFRARLQHAAGGRKEKRDSVFSE